MVKSIDNKEKIKEELKFPKILSAILKDRNINQRQAANLCGISDSVINDWLNGTTPHDLLLTFLKCTSPRFNKSLIRV